MLAKTTKKIFAKAFLRGTGHSVQYAINKNIFLGGFSVGIFLTSASLLSLFTFTTELEFSVITPSLLIVMGLLAGIVFLIAVDRSNRFWQGKEGEKRVFELLSLILPKDHYLIPSFPGENYDIDFVLVAPSGIYAIEVKNPGVKSKEEKISYRNGILMIDSEETGRSRPLTKPDPILQVVRNCVSLKKLLHEKLEKSYFIKGVVLFPDLYVHDHKESKFMVYSPERFVTRHLASAARELENYEVGNALKALRQHVNHSLVLERQD